MTVVGAVWTATSQLPSQHITFAAAAIPPMIRSTERRAMPRLAVAPRCLAPHR